MLDQEELFAALGLLLTKIEMCGASTQLTDAVCLCSDIRQSVGNRWNAPNQHAAERVRGHLPNGVNEEE